MNKITGGLLAISLALLFGIGAVTLAIVAGQPGEQSATVPQAPSQKALSEAETPRATTHKDSAEWTLVDVVGRIKEARLKWQIGPGPDGSVYLCHDRCVESARALAEQGVWLQTVRIKRMESPVQAAEWAVSRPGWTFAWGVFSFAGDEQMLAQIKRALPESPTP
jgi:hypothetical protein